MINGKSIQSKSRPRFKTGDTFILHRKFSREEPWVFGDLTKDYNPVHYDTDWTREKGFTGLICHGLLVGGMICEFGGQQINMSWGMVVKYSAPLVVM